MKCAYIALALAAVATLSGCASSRVVVLSSGAKWKVANLSCDRAIRYSDLTITVEDIGLPTAVPTRTYTIGKVGLERKKIEDATNLVKELDAVQLRMCQNVNTLVAMSDNDALIVRYLEASDRVFQSIVEVLKKYEQSGTDADLASANAAASTAVAEAKSTAGQLPNP